MIKRNQNLQKPVLQVLSVTPLQISGSERYRLEISDGTHKISGMLATQHNDLIKSQRLKPFSVIRIRDYITNEVQSKQIVILLDIEILETNAAKVGNPVDLGDQVQNQPATTPSNRVYAPPSITPNQPSYSPPQQYTAPKAVAPQQPPQQQTFHHPAPQQSSLPQQHFNPPQQQNFQQQQYQQPQQQYQLQLLHG